MKRLWHGLLAILACGALGTASAFLIWLLLYAPVVYLLGQAPTLESFFDALTLGAAGGGLFGFLMDGIGAFQPGEEEAGYGD